MLHAKYRRAITLHSPLISIMPSPSPAGYSGTPLPRKLGLKPGQRVFAPGAPEHYRELLAPEPDSLRFVSRRNARPDFVHVFTADRAHLAKELSHWAAVEPAPASLWISWPKKSSGVPSTVTEDVIRELCLPLRLVDIKVCAIDATWSGLRLARRRS